jgi:hypothetical protein
MLTALLAALASTLDTHLNWGASYWSNDLYKGIWVERIRKRSASRRELVLVARLSTVGILVIALAIMANLRSIQAAWQTSLLFGAGIGGVLILRWLWERINLYSEIAAIATSIVAAPLLLWTVEQDWLQLALMSAVSTLAVVLAAVATPPRAEQLVEFYRDVRPPGWWPRTAALAGESPAEPRRRLRRSVGLVTAAAGCVYALLVGGGLLLLQPEQWPLGAAALATAAAAGAWWWRLERAAHSE